MNNVLILISICSVAVNREMQTASDHFDDPSLLQNLQEKHVSALASVLLSPFFTFLLLLTLYIWFFEIMVFASLSEFLFFSLFRVHFIDYYY